MRSSLCSLAQESNAYWITQSLEPSAFMPRIPGAIAWSSQSRRIVSEENLATDREPVEENDSRIRSK